MLDELVSSRDRRDESHRYAPEVDRMAFRQILDGQNRPNDRQNLALVDRLVCFCPDLPLQLLQNAS